MFDQIESQPVWLQVIIGLFAFFGVVWLLSTLIGGYFGLRAESEAETYAKRNSQEAAEKVAMLEKELLEADPSLLEEALFIRCGRKRSILNIREWLKSMPQYAQENMASDIVTQELIEEVRGRRERGRDA